MRKVRLRYLLYLLSAVPFIFLTTRLFLWGPPVWPDEAIFTDAAITLNKTGHIATDIFYTAIPGVQTHFYFYPPLYFVVLAQWIKVFGASIESVRMSSVVFAAGALLFFGLVVRRVYRSDVLAALGVFFLGIDPSFGIASRTARMDIMIFFLLVFMVWVMVNEWFWVGGIVAAVAVMTHPMGFMVPAVGLLFLAKAHTRWREILRRGIALLVPSGVSLVLWIVSMGRSFSSFVAQYRLQFMLKKFQDSDLVVSFQEDRLWMVFFILVGVTLLAQAIVAYRHRKKMDIVWAGGLILCILLMAWGRVFWYTLYFEPFFALILISLLAGLPAIRGFWRVCILALLGGSLLVTVLITQELSSTFLHYSKPYHEVAAKVAALIPDGSHVLITAIPDPYFDLRKNSSLTLYEAPTTPTSDLNYRGLLSDTDSIVTTHIPGSFFKSYVGLFQNQIVPIDAGTASQMYVVTLLGRGDRK